MIGFAACPRIAKIARLSLFPGLRQFVREKLHVRCSQRSARDVRLRLKESSSHAMSSAFLLEKHGSKGDAPASVSTSVSSPERLEIYRRIIPLGAEGQRFVSTIHWVYARESINMSLAHYLSNCLSPRAITRQLARDCARGRTRRKHVTARRAGYKSMLKGKKRGTRLRAIGGEI